jgi:hypothetical protein
MKMMTDREFEMKIDREMQDEYTHSQNLKRKVKKLINLTNEDIEQIQSIIIEKIVNDRDEKQEANLNILLDKLGALKC